MKIKTYILPYICSAIMFCPWVINAQNQDSIATKSKESEKIHEIENSNFYNQMEQKQFNLKVIEKLKSIEEETSIQTISTQKSASFQEFALESIIEEPKEIDSLLRDSKEETHVRLHGPNQYDSRIEPAQLDLDVEWQNGMLTISESVGMIVEKEKLIQVSKNVFQLDISHKLGEVFKLCPKEAFSSQPSVGVGTAFIFDKKSMMTALHVLERPLQYYVVIFGYRVISENGLVNPFIEVDDIYYPKAILKKNNDLDVVEFSVDRNFNRPILEWESSQQIHPKESEIYAIGYPNGLPMKIALNASILDNSHLFYYYTSLDSFQGNSGSPVFNFYTNKVIGVLVSGEIDFKFNGHCNYAPSCKYPYCKGEKIIRMEHIKAQY